VAAKRTGGDEAFARLGFAVLRFWNVEIDRDLRSVMDTIVAALQAVDPTRPGFARPPSPAGRENPR
jgi:very-short-patch-repair endonuclease